VKFSAVASRRNMVCPRGTVRCRPCSMGCSFFWEGFASGSFPVFQPFKCMATAASVNGFCSLRRVNSIPRNGAAKFHRSIRTLSRNIFDRHHMGRHFLAVPGVELCFFLVDLASRSIIPAAIAHTVWNILATVQNDSSDGWEVEVRVGLAAIIATFFSGSRR
jgi:hypothetical protein